MQKIAEYKLVWQINVGHFMRDIEYLMKKGWEVYGNPFACPCIDEKGLIGSGLCQAMVKYEEQE